MIFGVEKLIFGQKSRKRYWTLIFYRKISVYKTTNKEICNERLFCYTEIQSAEYYPFISI